MDNENDITTIFNNPIKYIKLNEHRTQLDYFSTKIENVSKEKCFLTIFPKLSLFLSKFEENLSIHLKKQEIKDINFTKNLLFSDHKTSISLVYNYIKAQVINFNDEISHNLPEWSLLLKTHPRTSYHIIVALSLIHYDIYKYFDNIIITNFDKNILLWAMLLHDISKHKQISDIPNLEDDEKYINF